MTRRLEQVRTPYAVRCPEHGIVFLSEAEYDHQMNRPDATWRCPCGHEAVWQDDIYERAMGLDDPEG